MFKLKVKSAHIFTPLHWRAEALGCPGPTIFFDVLTVFLKTDFPIRNSSPKISDDPFLVIYQDFPNLSPKISDDFFSHLPKISKFVSQNFSRPFLVINLNFSNSSPKMSD